MSMFASNSEREDNSVKSVFFRGALYPFSKDLQETMLHA